MLTATAEAPNAGMPLAPVTGRSMMPRAGWAPSRLGGPTEDSPRLSRMRTGVMPWYCAGMLGAAGDGGTGRLILPKPPALSMPGGPMSAVRWRTRAARGSPGVARLALNRSAATPAAAGEADEVPAKHGE